MLEDLRYIGEHMAMLYLIQSIIIIQLYFCYLACGYYSCLDTQGLEKLYLQIIFK